MVPFRVHQPGHASRDLTSLMSFSGSSHIDGYSPYQR